MDIYSYLNSRDVAAYCRDLNHPFNAVECAFIVNASRRISVEEKLRLFREIIDTMPDESVEEKARMLKVNLDFTTDSFHEALGFYVSVLQQSLTAFMQGEPGTVYSFQYYKDDWDEKMDDYRLFSDYQAAHDALMQQLQDCDEGDGIAAYSSEIFKRRVDSDKYCCAVINSEGILTHLWDNYIELSDFFEDVWAYIPVPFKEGDLLYGSNPQTLPSRNIAKEPMVLTHICYQDRTEEKLKRLRRCWGAMDMTAFGYWLDGRGRLYDECMHSYHELEYYRGEIKGDVRLLKALSAHMKGEVTAHMFMIAFDALVHEREMDSVFPGWDYIPECYEKMGIADIHEKYEMCRKYDRNQKQE